MSIILFIIILAVLILVHEFGHFIVAKKSGVRVDEFGLGFPPKLWAKKFGDTLYTLNAIPFGGFVKIFGEDPHSTEIKEEDKATSFYYKPKWIQASILVAGVVFNLIFAWLLISGTFMMGVPATEGHSRWGEVMDAKMSITAVAPDSPAALGGIETGDTVLFVSSEVGFAQGESLTVENIQKVISESESQVEILYKDPSGVTQTAFIEPTLDDASGRKVIGVSLDKVGILRLPVHYAFLEGARTTYLFTKATAIGLGDFLWNVVTFKSDFSQVSGPVGIAGIVGEASGLGLVYVLSLVAVISINLAIINLVPFPALDGGRLLFVLIESITRRPINPKFAIWANTIGFVLLIILMIVVTGHDIFRLF
ncbi:MAG: site-2 protease family protein [Patescibacteria group bacterium]